ANEGSFPNYNDGSVSVLLGNADGTFQAAQTFPSEHMPQSVALADLTGNGLADLVVGAYGSYPYNVPVDVFLSNGDGTVQPARFVTAGAGPVAVTVADVTGDGVPDLLVGDAVAGTVNVLSGDGDGSFGAADTLPAGDHPWSVAAADVNRDGVPDLVVANLNTA